MSKATIQNALLLLLPISVALAVVQYMKMTDSGGSTLLCMAPTLLNILVLMGLLLYYQNKPSNSEGAFGGGPNFWTEEQFGTIQMPEGAASGSAEVHIKRVFKSEEITIKRRFEAAVAAAPGALVPVAAAAPSAAGSVASTVPALEYGGPSGPAIVTQQTETSVAKYETVQSLPAQASAGPSMVQLPIGVAPPDAASMVQLPVGVAPARPDMVQLPIGIQQQLREVDIQRQETIQQIPVRLSDVPIAPIGPVVPVPIQEIGPAGDASLRPDEGIYPVRIDKPIESDKSLQPDEGLYRVIHDPSEKSAGVPYVPMQQVPVRLEQYQEPVPVVPVYGGPATVGSYSMQQSLQQEATMRALTQGGAVDSDRGTLIDPYTGRSSTGDAYTIPLNREVSQTPFNLQGITVGTRLVYLSITKQAHIEAAQVQAYTEGRLGDPTAITMADVPPGLNLPGLRERLAGVEQEQLATGQGQVAFANVQRIGPTPGAIVVGAPAPTMGGRIRSYMSWFRWRWIIVALILLVPIFLILWLIRRYYTGGENKHDIFSAIIGNMEMYQTTVGFIFGAICCFTFFGFAYYYPRHTYQDGTYQQSWHSQQQRGPSIVQQRTHLYAGGSR